MLNAYSSDICALWSHREYFYIVSACRYRASSCHFSRCSRLFSFLAVLRNTLWKIILWKSWTMAESKDSRCWVNVYAQKKEDRGVISLTHMKTWQARDWWILWSWILPWCSNTSSWPLLLIPWSRTLTLKNCSQFMALSTQITFSLSPASIFLCHLLNTIYSVLSHLFPFTFI